MFFPFIRASKTVLPLIIIRFFTIIGHIEITEYLYPSSPICRLYLLWRFENVYMFLLKRVPRKLIKCIESFENKIQWNVLIRDRFLQCTIEDVILFSLDYAKCSTSCLLSSKIIILS